MSSGFGPLIADDAGTVAHVRWNGSALVDSFGNSWTQNGTVPQVARSGRTPAGAGAFSDANYYSLGTGNDVLDFAGNFSGCVVSSITSGANSPALLSNGAFNTAGYYVQHGGATGADVRITFNAAASNSPVADAAGTALNQINCICFGRAGTTGYLKANLRTLVTATAGTMTAATATQARIGRYTDAGFAVAGTIYEVWLSTTTPTDALFISIMNRVRSRAGVTAW
jgi:hypothetical protein